MTPDPIMIGLGAIMLLYVVLTVWTARRQLRRREAMRNAALYLGLGSLMLGRGSGVVTPAVGIAITSVLIVAMGVNWVLAYRASKVDEQGRRQGERVRTLMLLSGVWLALGLGAALFIKSLSDPVPFALGAPSQLIPLVLFMSGAGMIVQLLAAKLDSDAVLSRWWAFALSMVPTCALMMWIIALVEHAPSPAKVVAYVLMYGPVVAFLMAAAMTPLARRLLS